MDNVDEPIDSLENAISLVEGGVWHVYVTEKVYREFDWRKYLDKAESWEVYEDEAGEYPCGSIRAIYAFEERSNDGNVRYVMGYTLLGTLDTDEVLRLAIIGAKEESDEEKRIRF